MWRPFSRAIRGPQSREMGIHSRQSLESSWWSCHNLCSSRIRECGLRSRRSQNRRPIQKRKLTLTERVLLPEYSLPATRQLDVELWVVLDSRVVLFPVCTVVREAPCDAVRMLLTRPSCSLRQLQASPCELEIGLGDIGCRLPPTS